MLINIGFVYQPLPQMVKVYDSMRTGDVPSNTKESIATLLKYILLSSYCVSCVPRCACNSRLIDPFVDFLHSDLHIPFVKAMTLQE